MNNNVVYVKEYGMVFMRNSQGFFEPLYHNIKEENGIPSEGEEVKKGTVFYDFVMWAKYASSKVDLKTGRRKMGFYELYQYYLSFEMIKSVLSQSSHKLLYSISRQAGEQNCPFIKRFIKKTQNMLESCRTALTTKV